MNSSAKNHDSEKGSAGVKFIFVLLFIVLVANAGFNYVPVAYSAESLKSDMGTAVLQGLALPGKLNAADNIKERIQKAIKADGIPPEAIVDVKQVGNVLTARVAYAKQVNILPFGIYKYNYVFDYTATPSGFLTKQ